MAGSAAAPRTPTPTPEELMNLRRSKSAMNTPRFLLSAGSHDLHAENRSLTLWINPVFKWLRPGNQEGVAIDKGQLRAAVLAEFGSLSPPRQLPSGWSKGTRSGTTFADAHSPKARWRECEPFFEGWQVTRCAAVKPWMAPGPGRHNWRYRRPGRKGPSPWPPHSRRCAAQANP